MQTATLSAVSLTAAVVLGLAGSLSYAPGALADNIILTNRLANPLSTPDATSAAQTVAPWTEPAQTMPFLSGLSVFAEQPPFSFLGQGSLPASPDLFTNFLALADDNTTIPPDTQGSVSKNHVFTMLNSQFSIRTLGGASLFSGSLSNFWSPIWPYNIQLTDPRIVYDAASQRWVTAVLGGPESVNSFILVAVSFDSSPTNGFYYSGFKADTNNASYADYTKIGLNYKWFVLHADIYSLSSGSLLGSRIYVFNKTNWYAGGFAAPTILSTTNSDPNFPNAGLEMPAITYDTNQGTLYLVQNVVTNNNQRVRMFSITGNIGSESLNTNLPYLQATNLSWNFSGAANFAPQLGMTNRISTDDSRILNVVYRNGFLWFTHTIFLPGGTNASTRSSVQWWQVNPANWAILQRGLVDDPSGSTFYAFPSIAVNRFGDALVGYSSFGTNQYATANYSFRAFNDPQPGDLEGSRVLKAGQGSYYKTFGGSQNRWGDLSATVVDPRNDADLWTIQEYAATPAASGLTNGTGRWGTWWGQLKVVVPKNDNFSSAIVLSGSQGATNGTNVRATKESGEPTHDGNANTVSVWYNWTAPTNGNVVIDTKGSLLDAILAVYTGSSVSSLTLVTNDHNSLGSSGFPASQVVFNAAAGTTYRIAVDGSGGVQSTFTLNWNQALVPVFVKQPQSQNIYQANNVTFSALAIGRPSPTYQWRFNGAKISGATNASYTITGVTTNNAGNFTLLATNSSGSTTSIVAILTVETSQATLGGSIVTNNTFQFTVSQVSGLSYIIQANTNLSTTNWIPLLTNTAPFTLTNTAFTNNPQRFFRALYKP